ncbi:unnamed protein product [Closterium sp. NIES-65]|nr:unnamed protein product [Closterium sp. NIES-65]
MEILAFQEQQASQGLEDVLSQSTKDLDQVTEEVSQLQQKVFGATRFMKERVQQFVDKNNSSLQSLVDGLGPQQDEMEKDIEMQKAKRIMEAVTEIVQQGMNDTKDEVKGRIARMGASVKNLRSANDDKRRAVKGVFSNISSGIADLREKEAMADTEASNEVARKKSEAGEKVASWEHNLESTSLGNSTTDQEQVEATCNAGADKLVTMISGSYGAQQEKLTSIASSLVKSSHSVPLALDHHKQQVEDVKGSMKRHLEEDLKASIVKPFILCQHGLLWCIMLT